ncbi:MAG: hypothetical protein J6A49_01780 [Clostridia bacterium]|nr:hypothetical protein [Clostridia bacterium]
MYDIHCHILYDVDDGADTLPESLEMAEIACASGTKVIVATPHSNISEEKQNFWNEDFKRKLADVQSAINDARMPIKILPGQEILCRGDFIEHLKSGNLITLNGSRYPLVEFSFTEHSESVLKKLQLLIAEGFVPVVAHPERYAFVTENFDSLLKLKKMGCLVQLNTGSFEGKFGRKAHDLAVKMLGLRLADVVASDGHSPFLRTPILADAHEYISERYSTNYAELLLAENPEKILADKKI